MLAFTTKIEDEFVTAFLLSPNFQFFAELTVACKNLEGICFLVTKNRWLLSGKILKNVRFFSYVEI